MGRRTAQGQTAEIPEPANSEGQRLVADQLARRDRELAILAEVAARIHGEEEAGAILDIVLDAIVGRMGLSTAWIFMSDGPRQGLRLAASRGLPPEYHDELRQRGLGQCPCLRAITAGQPMAARNNRECPRMPTFVGKQGVPHACIPLRLAGGGRGVLNVAARAGEIFSDEELRFLETLGHQICLAVERSRHRAAERARSQESRAMAAITKAIGGSLDVAVVLRAVGETAGDILGIERVHIFLGDDPHSLRVAHLSGLPHPELEEGQDVDAVRVGANLYRLAIEGRALVRVDDWEQDGRVNKALARRWETGSALVAPLLARNRLLGLLVLTRTKPHVWTDEQADLAEALAAQAAVAIENARLYEDLRQAYNELKDTQQRLIQNERMAVVGTFASGLAHEVRNPLNSMGLQLALLERRIASLDGAVAGQIQGLSSVIRKEIQRLDALVGDFLLFSRTNRMHFRPTSLDALLDEIVRLLRPEGRVSNVALRRERPEGPLPKLPMDAEKMKQVFINLLRNAIEALPDGGLVVIESRLVDSRAAVVVRDNGPGLPEGLDVFQLFVSTKQGGTGLGLSIAQQIVLDHGGEIAASRTPGGGATFTVTLPLGVDREQSAPA
jgi:signal transduction histidine kinase